MVSREEVLQEFWNKYETLSYRERLDYIEELFDFTIYINDGEKKFLEEEIAVLQDIQDHREYHKER